ncbi:MAG: PHP domain-containing protein [Bacteroidales bacterium]|nr:PHP domain-containing protein [Bacteroidales bacterium]
MNSFRADLHIHTLLSPCGDLDMTPDEIVRIAKEKQLSIIGITDHNTTKHVSLAKYYAQQCGIFVLGGAEVTTKEEAHCLAFFETDETLQIFDDYLQKYMQDIWNDTDKFGYQVQIDKEANIIYEEPKFLPAAIDQSLEEIEKKVHSLNGLFIPAHIDKPKTSVPSQLGFIPFDLKIDGVELSIRATKTDYLLRNRYLKNKTFIQSSDAHYTNQIGTTYCYFNIEHPSFEEIRKAFIEEDGRNILLKEFVEK